MAFRLIKGVISATIATAAIFGSVFSVSAYELERHSQAEIIEMYEKMKFDIHSEPEYVEDYSVEYPSYAGRISDDTLEEGLNSINFCRYLAGLPYDVGLTEEYNIYAQNASLVSYMNKRLSHTPDQPEGMSDEVFALGKKGAGESNIGIGYLNIQSALVQGYMSDTDKSNLAVLGHRRWILNPDMKNTGLGMVYSSTAMYVRDKTREEKFTGDYICWPPYVMPYEMMGTSSNGYAFSVTLNNRLYDQPERDKVVVQLTSKTLGQTWTFNKDSSDTVEDMVGYFHISTENCGINNCIIFNPGMLPENDVVDVKITGIYKNGVEAPISYKVNFFNMLDDNDYKIDFKQSSYEMELGETLLIQGYDNPLKNGTKTSGDLLVWYLCKEGDVSDYVDMIQSGGTILLTAKKEGVIELYLGNHDEDGWFRDKKPSTVTITHRHTRGDWIEDAAATETEAGARHNVCTECGKEIDQEILPATSVAVARVELSDDKVIYNRNGTPVPSVKVYAGDKRLTEGTDYKVTYKNTDKPGTATITIEGMGYFSGSQTVSYEVTRRDTVAVSSLNISFNNNQTVLFTGRKQEPKITVTEGDNVLEKDLDYTVEYENNLNAGTGTVTVTGMGDYDGSVSLNFTIEPADIGYPWVNDKLTDVKYTGRPIMLRLDLKSQVTGKDLIEGVDYTVSYENNVEIGTATVTVTGIGNYSGVTTNFFSIVSPDDYTGPEDRDDLVEMDQNTVITISSGANSSNTVVKIIGKDGKVYEPAVAIGSSFYVDLPEGDYEVWVVRQSAIPAKADITVGGEHVSVNIDVYLYGDVNRDGVINVNDVALTAAFIKGVSSPADSQQRDLADVNRDGVLTINDITMLAAHVKGIQSINVEVNFDMLTYEAKPEDERPDDDEVTTDELA